MDKASSLILKYCSTHNVDYAYLLNGKWGAGKTFFVQNELKDINNKGCRTIYISLFDKKEWSEVMASIIHSVAGSMTSAQKLINGLIKEICPKNISNTISMMGEIITPFVNEKVISIIKDYLVIIDDLERTNIPINHLMGKISEVLLVNKIHVLIVSDVSHMDKESQKVFFKWKEKIVRKTIELDHGYLKKAISSIVAINGEHTTRYQYYNDSREIFDVIVDHVKVTNLRSWQFAFDIFDELFKNKYDNNYYFYNELIQTIVLTVQFCIERELKIADHESFLKFIKERNMVEDNNSNNIDFKIRYVLLHQAPYCPSLVGYIQGCISDIQEVYQEIMRYFPFVDGLAFINAKLMRAKDIKEEDEMKQFIEEAEKIVSGEEIQDVIDLYHLYNIVSYLIHIRYENLFKTLPKIKNKTMDLLFTGKYMGKLDFFITMDYSYFPELRFMYDRAIKEKNNGDIEALKRITGFSGYHSFKEKTGYTAEKFSIDIVQKRNELENILINLSHSDGWVLFDFIQEDYLKHELPKEEVEVLLEILASIIANKSISKFDLIPLENIYEIVKKWIDDNP